MALYDKSGNPIDTGGGANDSRMAAIEGLLYNYRKWADKVLFVQGNSLTPWGKYLAEYLHMDGSVCTKVGGSLTGNRTAAEIIEFVEETYPTACDLIILQGDGNVTTTGDFSDQLDGENPVNSWAGRVNYLIRTLRARYPNVVIALMADSIWYPGVNDQYSAVHNRNNRDAMQGLAAYNCCAYLDVDHFTPFNPTHALDNYYTGYVIGSTTIDGVHPNDYYMKAKAQAIMEYVVGLVFDPAAPNNEVEGWQDNITYTITNNLTNCTNSMSAADWAAHTKYAATIRASSGTLSGVTVTMGGADITSEVYSNGKIAIGSVTGDVVITATAG